MDNPNVQSYSVVHYGADYLPYAIQSVYNSVDRFHVIYTPHPSHGHSTDKKPIESLGDIFDASYAFDPKDKVKFYEVSGIWEEGRQRDYAESLCSGQGADLILVLDCDEVWDEDVLTAALNHAWVENSARRWLITFTHFWRSFDWVCRDNNWPVRIIDTRHKDGTGYIPHQGGIYHFGYAVTDKVMEYKWQIHGHKSELRKDWMLQKWHRWKPGINDVHPTNGDDWWNPERFDKSLLPEFMRNHPFYNKEIIE